MNPHPFVILITGVLIILWSYAAYSKLSDLTRFKHAMSTQVFPNWLGKILVFILPLSEIIVIVFLIIPRLRLIGMYSSFIMMLAFTFYIAGAIFGLYDRRPCACGGLFNRLGWNKHFKLNIMLTLIAFLGIIIMKL